LVKSTCKTSLYFVVFSASTQDVLVTPFAQLLNSLRNIRSNVMALANIAPARYVPCFHELFLPRDTKLARYFRPSRLSVTSRYCIETTGRIELGFGVVAFFSFH